MTILALILVAVVLVGWQDIQRHALWLYERLPRLAITWRHAVASGLIVAAASIWWIDTPADPPIPVPSPAGPLDLRGLFVGQHAAADAASVAALTAELADEIEWDGQQAKPFLTSGVAVDELRQRARVLRCRGLSIGARQPAARDAIARHLEQAVGTAGGPIDAAKRGAWVTALRDVAEAARHVTQ